MSNRTIHILRYGTVAEKAHLVKAFPAFDYLSINGNTAAYVSTAIAKFIIDNFFSDNKKGYFIDPITYAFQKEIHLLQSESKTTGERKIKKSIDKLINYYNFPANKVYDNNPITIKDFTNSLIMENFCHRVLDFQYNLVHKHVEENDLKKYLEYVSLGGLGSIQQFRPQFLIAPYFYLDAQDSDFEKWLELNIQFSQIATDQAASDFSGKDVFAQIVVSKSILRDIKKIEIIADAYKTINCAGYTIWVDDLNEHEASFEELIGFSTLLKRLHNKPIYNMYGGYLSILLTHSRLKLLDGVSHGLEYGESRKVYPVGGGIPVSKYYFYPVHQRLDFTKAFYLLEYAKAIDTSLGNWGTPEKYYLNICSCSQCKTTLKHEMINFVDFESKEFYEIRYAGHIQRRKKASANTKTNCLYHYLLSKHKEFLSVEKRTLDYLLNQLIEQKEYYSQCEALYDDELGYLGIWVTVLNNLREGNRRVK